MTKTPTKALNPALVCFTVATVAAFVAFALDHVTAVRVGWLYPLAFLGLLVGGVLALALPDSRTFFDRGTRLGFAFVIVVGGVGLIRWLA